MKKEEPQKFEYNGEELVASELFAGLISGEEKSPIPVQVVNKDGHKIPGLLLAIGAKTDAAGKVVLEHVAYVSEFKPGTTTLPADFKLKLLSGKMGQKMVDKYNEHLTKAKEEAERLKKERENMPAWEVVLNVMCPKIGRPRRTSLHTLATVIGHPDPLKLGKELEKSGKVVGYVCPDVKTPIFYLKSLATHPGMIDTRDSGIWGKLSAFFEKHPYPATQGFKRFSEGKWSGGSYGKGTFIPAVSDMTYPYEAGDYEYARRVIKALKDAGYTPGIEDPEKPELKFNDGKKVVKTEEKAAA